MSADTVILSIAAILVFSGLLQRVLDRMHLNDRQALLLVGAMLAGTFLPNLTLGDVVVNIGGGLIPLGVCVYLLIRADEKKERWRACIGSLITGAAVYALSRLLPDEAEAMLFDPMWVYGLVGGVIAWLLGRSRRCAFICGVAGILLADAATAIAARFQGYETQLILGGAGIADAVVISGVIAVLFCELVGETIERMIRKAAAREGRT